VAGYPVRDEFFEQKSRSELRQQLKLDPDCFTMLAFGGSQGARNINQALYQILPELLAAGIVVIHVTGTHSGAEYDAVVEGSQQLEQMRTRHPELDWENLYRQHDYLFGIADYFRAVDLLICRAGAGALFEIAATRSASILLPKAGLPGDHQTLNALSLRERRACEVILEEPQPVEDGIECLLNGKRLLAKIVELSQDEKLCAGMKEQLTALMPESPLETIIELVINDTRPDSQPEIPDSDLLQLASMSPAKLYYDLETRMNDLTFAPTPDQQEYLRYRAGVLLASSNWWSRNFAVKLVGLLSDNEQLPLLVTLFNDRRPVSPLKQLFGGDFEQRGFIRRNLIEALVQLNSFKEPMGEMIFDGLFDPYWEVVSQSLRATAMYADHLPHGRFMPRIVELMEHRNFEIVAHALQAFGEWARSDEDIWLTEKLFTHHNPRVREGLVRAFIRMTRRGVIHHPDRLLQQLQQLLSTSTHFYPLFPLKREIRELTQALSNQTGHENDSNKLEQS
jgi:UDP-N-acetylglucosamine--N-acetylmuramyl-(pentapeptide) pyrophosphoryl-undecaprenol N-acetylglucosamine transferase